ncbi:MAG TPA: valine--tRNA ligase, partial [Acidimicrobiales bacterium]|nr:valine--tRNA ligase [Acidimicrobiales bacterium]
VWSWWHDGSIHLSRWPTLTELGPLPERPGSIYQPVCDALEAVRREKSSAKVSQRASVATMVVSAPEEFADALRVSASDLRSAGNVEQLVIGDASEVTIDVTLAP